MALHSIQAALISVTCGRFLPSGCHANVEAQYEFLNIFDWKGNRVSVYVCVWEREFDHLSAFVWGVRAYFCTQHHGLHYNMGHASVIYLEEMKWACPEAYIVCGFACWMYLCVAEARCACAICVEKIPTGAFLQLPGNLWKASQRNRGLVGEDAQTWKPAV